MIDTNLQTCSRSEADDIAATILDGVDSFILTNETSTGKNPSLAVEQLTKIIAEAENVVSHQRVFNNMKMTQGSNVNVTDVLISTACTIAKEPGNIDLLLCLTENGNLARYLSKFRFEQPVFACSTDSTVVR